MASLTDSNSIITLGKSTAIVSEFFGFAVNSIMYNRGLYPAESFQKVKRYGLPMLLTQHKALKPYLANLTKQVAVWLEAGHLSKITLVIMNKATKEALERWTFAVDTDDKIVQNGGSKEKSHKQIQREIQALMRQIVSSVSFLPCHDKPCTYCFQAKVSPDAKIPDNWTRGPAKLIVNPQTVILTSFDTEVHKVSAIVSFKKLVEKIF